MPQPIEPRGTDAGRAVLELATRDPLSAVRHVVACLARRAYPLLGLVCLPGDDGTGRLVVAVADDGRLSRLMVELAGLPEVSAACLGDPGSEVLAPGTPVRAPA